MAQEKISQETMKLIVAALVNHSGYIEKDVKIIGNTIETKLENETEYLVVTFERPVKYSSKLFYNLQQPEVYFQRHSISDVDRDKED